MICLENGTWDKEAITCNPKCGYISKAAISLIVHGLNVTEVEVPWLVGVYANYNILGPQDSPIGFEHICQASIISEKVLISAAHCWSNIHNDKLEPFKFKVGAGKRHRKIDSEYDLNAQIRNISHIYIPERFQGIDGYFDADIAVVGIEGYFVYSTYVLPICLNSRDDSLADKTVTDDSIGVVAGWGLNSDGVNSEILKKININKANFQKCRSEARKQHFEEFVRDDKLCGGYGEKSNKAGPCTGDSGSSWAFEKDDIYYLYGIVSNAMRKDNTCDLEFYTLFTNVIYYLDFIEQSSQMILKDEVHFNIIN